MVHVVDEYGVIHGYDPKRHVTWKHTVCCASVQKDWVLTSQEITCQYCLAIINKKEGGHGPIIHSA